MDISKRLLALAMRLAMQHEARTKAVEVCPACRGYNVERQWCDVCKRTGYVEKPRHD